MSVASSGEFGLIERIKSRFVLPAGLTGIGDDCAIIPQRSGYETLVSTDMLMEGVHFLLEDASPYDIGWKSAAVNISDIAAMGGEPTGTFLSFSLPSSLDLAWVDGFIDGYKAVSDLFRVPLLGGDTTSSIDRICICVTVVGRVGSGRAKLRSGALAGDLVCVTGPLGDSAAGLKLILEGRERDTLSQALVRRHYRPLPRVKEGLLLGGTEGVHAMMDISDGIGSDLRHILKASGVGARISLDSIPLSAELKAVSMRYGWDAVSLAVNGGEDYELLFTADGSALERLQIPVHVIGSVTEEGGVVIENGTGVKGNVDESTFLGFRHF